MVYLYTDHQALEPLIKRNRAYLQYSARLTRWLDRLTHFDIPIKHRAARNLALTDYLSRHPTDEATTEEVNVEECVIITLSELLKKKHKYGQLSNTDRKLRSDNQSANMILKTNRELTNEMLSRGNPFRAPIKNVSGANKHRQSIQST